MKKEKIYRVFSHLPELITPRLTLRRMLVSDTEDMYEYASRDIVTRYLLWRTHPDDEHTKRYIDYVVSLYKSGQFFDFAIEYRENSKMIGTCGFTRFDFHSDVGEIGYVIHPAYHGQGYDDTGNGDARE